MFIEFSGKTHIEGEIDRHIVNSERLLLQHTIMDISGQMVEICRVFVDDDGSGNYTDVDPKEMERLIKILLNK